MQHPFCLWIGNISVIPENDTESSNQRFLMQVLKPCHGIPWLLHIVEGENKHVSFSYPQIASVAQEDKYIDEY